MRTKVFFVAIIATLTLGLLSCGKQEKDNGLMSKEFKTALDKMRTLYENGEYEKAYYFFKENVKPLAKNNEDQYHAKGWVTTLKASVLKDRVSHQKINRDCVEFVDDYTLNETLEMCLTQTSDWFWAHELWKKNRTSIKEVEDIFPYLQTPKDFKECYQLFYLRGMLEKAGYKELLAEKLKDSRFQAELLLLEWDE